MSGTRLLCATALSASTWLEGAAQGSQVFTTNAVCLKNNCINPVFPALEDLHKNSQQRWQCSSLHTVNKHLGFCQGAVNYDPSLKMTLAADVAKAVKEQDNAALTAYLYHLAGMGYDGWDYHEPRHTDDDCVKAIWRNVCYTHFPKAPVGCFDGYEGNYLRPCQSSCSNYVRQCSVQCCDESVQCVFSHEKKLTDTLTLTTYGYTDHDGPSSLCTGAARERSVTNIVLAVLFFQMFSSFGADGRGVRGAASQCWSLCRMLGVCALVTIAMSLQGCDLEVPEHTVGNWRGEEDYLIKHEFVPPGMSPRDAVLNSCSLETLAQSLQCSGRGVCTRWDIDDLSNDIAFCVCDRDWADPECRTRRKSQFWAFFLSIFFGVFGLDQFYLGHTVYGWLKLLSLGGAGIWWVIDIIRIGSAPVLAKPYRVADDLPHWGFVLIVVFITTLLGYIIAYKCVQGYREKKIREALIHQMEEEKYLAEPFSAAYEWDGPRPPTRRPVTGPAVVISPLDDAERQLAKQPAASALVGGNGVVSSAWGSEGGIRSNLMATRSDFGTFKPAPSKTAIKQYDY